MEGFVFVNNMARHGLHLHLGAEIQMIWRASMHALWPQPSARISALGYRPEALGAPYEGRIIFRIAP